MGALLTLLPTILQIGQGVLPMIEGHENKPAGWLEQNLPLILATVGNGAQLLAQWHSLAALPGGPTDAQLAELAQATESALADSQAALR